MKILYIAPYPPLKSGVADYAYYFKNAIEKNLYIQMDMLDIYQNENICTFKNFLSLRRKEKMFNKALLQTKNECIILDEWNMITDLKGILVVKLGASFNNREIL